MQISVEDGRGVAGVVANGRVRKVRSAHRIGEGDSDSGPGDRYRAGGDLRRAQFVEGCGTLRIVGDQFGAALLDGVPQFVAAGDKGGDAFVAGAQRIENFGARLVGARFAIGVLA